MDDTTTTELPPLIDADLNFTEGYQDRVGEHAEGSTFKNLPDLFKTNKELHRSLTEVNQTKADLTKQIAEYSPPELPADAAAYKALLKLPELPDGITLSDEVIEKAVSYSLEKGHGPDALSDFLAFDVERVTMENDARKTAEFERIQSARGVIEKQVGAQNYDMALADAQHVAQMVPGASEHLTGESLANDPGMVILLAGLKSRISEGTLKGASGTTMDGSGSKLSQSNDIVSNPENPLNAAFHDNSHPQYEYARQEHARLITESAP